MVVAIVGTAGVPANYGGFETLAENLIKNLPSIGFIVYCSDSVDPSSKLNYPNAERKFWKLSANGVSSITYDILSIIHAVFRRVDTILVLGVSGAVAIPFIKLFRPEIQVVTNIDGLEWKRDKWGWLARRVLKTLEAIAVKHSDTVISDNRAIRDYVVKEYSRESRVIAYGGDHVYQSLGVLESKIDCRLPRSPFALSICRIEKENNVEMILAAFEDLQLRLVFIGNWRANDYGKSLLDKYGKRPNLYLMDPIYDTGALQVYRENCCVYLHGHSAGGTNPSLVEAMHIGKRIVAFDCVYNRHTLAGFGEFFGDVDSLEQILSVEPTCKEKSDSMQKFAQTHYSWRNIASSYLEAFGKKEDSGL